MSRKERCLFSSNLQKSRPKRATIKKRRHNQFGRMKNSSFDKLSKGMTFKDLILSSK